MLQRMTKSRIVTRPQANISPVAKSASPCRQNTPRLRGNASHTLEKRAVRIIFGGPREIRDSRRARDKYSQKAKRPPQIVVHTTDSKPPRGCTPQPDDIVHKLGAPPPWRRSSHYYRGCWQPRPPIINRQREHYQHPILRRLLEDRSKASRLDPDDLSSLWVHRGKYDPCRNHQASCHLRGATSNGDCDNWLSCDKVPISLQRSTG